MLEIHPVDILKQNELKIVKNRTKKTQIFLYDTQRRLDDFIMKLKYRQNGGYENIPHFVVSKTGVIYEIFNTKYSSKTFGDPDIDKRLIKISIENLGWLNKNTITGFLNNWINDPYRIDPYIKSWRNHYFWDSYTEKQMKSIVDLCKKLCEENEIPFELLTLQGYVETISKFKGIVCKSNYSNIYTDINPSFNFKLFYNHAKTR